MGRLLRQRCPVGPIIFAWSASVRSLLESSFPLRATKACHLLSDDTFCYRRISCFRDLVQACKQLLKVIEVFESSEMS